MAISSVRVGKVVVKPKAYPTRCLANIISYDSDGSASQRSAIPEGNCALIWLISPPDAYLLITLNIAFTFSLAVL